MKTEIIALGNISQNVSLKMWSNDILGHYTCENYRHQLEIIQEILGI